MESLDLTSLLISITTGIILSGVVAYFSALGRKHSTPKEKPQLKTTKPYIWMD